MRVLEITDRLLPEDRKRNIPHPFVVPAGATQLDIALSWTPKQVSGLTGSNDLSLSLFGPDGARGAGHNRPNNEIHLSVVGATPGYRPGPVTPGNWSVVLDTHMIVAPVEYAIMADVSFTPAPGEAPTWLPGRTSPRGPGWYRGDLHGHTLHSDGDWDVPDLVAAARHNQFDFVTLTDHNTVSPLAQMASLAADDLLTMGGLELTTYWGHALALGVREWIDWRVRPGEYTMPDIAAAVAAAGGLFVIAHPMSVGDPVCTGCDWRYDDMMPGNARCVEIWNGGPWSEDNERGLSLWYSWLNQGYRMVATAGSDIHGPSDVDTFVGLNNVYAAELSERAILDAVRHGHLALSSGPRLTLSAIDDDGQVAMMGDRLHAGEGTVTARWQEAPADAQLLWVFDGVPGPATPIAAAGDQRREIAQARWCVVEMRDGRGEMLAVTNPCFFGAGWR